MGSNGASKEDRGLKNLWSLIGRTSAPAWGFGRPALAPPGFGTTAGIGRLAFSPRRDRQRGQGRLAEARPSDEPGISGQLGSLEVRLARDARELREAQRLRFRVFYEEMSAIPNPVSALLRRDSDRFDRICHHLVVLDHDHRASLAIGAAPKVVGTYRMLRQEVADECFGFYTMNEFDISPLLACHREMRFLELGRSCVLASHRDKRTLELLWRGIHAYVRRHRIDVMIGCASLEGTRPAALAEPLSFLHHYASCPAGWEVRAQAERYVPMNILPKSKIDVKSALRSLPPLIKGYLRLGARFGDGAVIDRQFGTTDVFVLLRMSDIAERYVERFASSATGEAA